MAPSILVVGKLVDARALAELLGAEGYVTAIATAQTARPKALRFRPDIVIADVAFPTIDGMALLRSLEILQPRPTTVMVSSRPTQKLDPLGVICLSKPLDLPLLSETLAVLTRAQDRGALATA